MVDIIEGEAVRIESAVAVIEAREMLAEAITPEATVSLATRMATVLADIVEQRKLYSVISGKKFPQVEAWMTIGRMDNVVAREAGNPERHEDGSYEAVVELIRLSDGMVIGRGSALCGTKGDRPWDGRAEPARRSMAVTRATSRAFRQQYSWIMALAGYEPTPADEMPGQENSGQPVNATEREPENDAGETLALLGEFSKTGRVARGQGDKSDCQFREEPQGWRIGFRLEFKEDKNIAQVIAGGAIGAAIHLATGANADALLGQKVKATGLLYEVHKPQRQMYLRLIVSALETDEWKLPAESAEAESAPLFKDDDLSDLPGYS